jgi:23S rRNA (pseudouridine1915-N3)-methyltransferase
MKLRIHSVAGKTPSWVETGVQDFTRRLPSELQPIWHTEALDKRRRSANTVDSRAEESDRLWRSVPAQAHTVLLDVQGQSWDTPQLAEHLATWQMARRDVVILIGGPDGVTPSLIQAVDQRWSLSALTLPHMLVRIVLVEQLYRAWTLLQGHPYHKS